MHSRSFELSFLGLSVLGFVLLWLMMGYNGTLIGLLSAAWKGSFADGRPLRTTYIGLPPVDFAIAVLVAFFDPQIDGTDNGTWLFMFNLEALLQTAVLWVLVEAKREGQSGTHLKRFWLWPLLWNFFGAAVVLPLYLYFHTLHTKARRVNPMSSTQSRAFVPAVILTGFMPALAMLFGYRFTTDSGRQAIAAVCQFAPLMLGVAIYLISPTALNRPRADWTDDNSDPVCYSYVFGGLISASSHIYTLAVALFSNDQSARFGRLFIPSPSSVISGSIENILHGGLLFLQYDYIIISVSCALWVYAFIETDQVFPDMQGRIVAIALILCFMLLLGPGGTVCGALWLREKNLRVTFAQQHRN